MVRFSSLGDVVLTSPVITALRRTYPQAKIDFLVHAHFSSIVSRFATAPDNIIPFNPATGALGLVPFARKLSRNNYDLLIDLHDSLRSKVLRKLIRAGEKRIYRKPRLRRFLLFYLWLNRFKPDFGVVNEYLRFAGVAAAPGSRPQMTVDKDQLPAALANAGLRPGFVAVVPGAAWPRKVWPGHRYVDMLTSLGGDGHPQIALLGGQDDAICDEIAGGLPLGSVVNLKGRTSLEEALSLLGGASLVIGADTGLVHAAEAMGVPAVLIQGPTAWQTGAAVHHPKSTVHEVNLWCRPCSQNGSRKCYRREQYCLTGISAGDVRRTVFDMLGLPV